MPCEEFGGMILCRGRARRIRCPLCRDKWVELECDFEVALGKTCDQKMCPRCATKVRGKGVSIDYCPSHKEPGLAALRAQAAAKAN